MGHEHVVEAMRHKNVADAIIEYHVQEVMRHTHVRSYEQNNVVCVCVCVECVCVFVCVFVFVCVYFLHATSRGVTCK